MAPTTDLGPVGQVFERLFIRAWMLFDDSKYDEAYYLCEKLLPEPHLGTLHRAGFHLMLGQPPNGDYEWHADEAVRLYESMGGPEEMLEQAKAVQAKARADSAIPATEQQLRDWKEEQVRAADEEFQDGFHDGEPDVGVEVDYNEEMLDAAVEGKADAKAEVQGGPETKIHST